MSAPASLPRMTHGSEGWGLVHGTDKEPPGRPADQESPASLQDGLNGAELPPEPTQEQPTRKPRAERTRAVSTMTPEAFKAWRKRLGWSQREAARQLGISERQVGYYDHGEKSIPYLDALAIEALERRVRHKEMWEAFRLLGRAFGVNVDEVSAKCAENSEGNEENAAT